MITFSSIYTLIRQNADIAELGILPGSTLLIEPKAMKVSIELPDGTKHTVAIDATDKSDSIASKIKEANELLSQIMLVSDGGNKLEINTKQIFES